MEQEPTRESRFSLPNLSKKSFQGNEKSSREVRMSEGAKPGETKPADDRDSILARSGRSLKSLVSKHKIMAAVSGAKLVEEQTTIKDFICWEPTSFHQRRSLLLRVPRYLTPDRPCSNRTAEKAAYALQLPAFIARYQGFNGGVRGVIMVIGHSSGLRDYLAQRPGQLPLPDGLNTIETIQRLKLMFGRSIARAALDTHSVVVTAGVDKDAVGYMGRGNRDRNHIVPLVGVVSKGLVHFPGGKEINEPPRDGDPFNLSGSLGPMPISPTGSDTEGKTPTRLLTSGSHGVPPALAPPPLQDKRRPLQSDHTHFVMIENTETIHDKYATRFRFDLVRAIVSGYANTDPKHEDDDEAAGANKPDRKLESLPVMAYLVNGGSAELADAVECARLGYPICVIRGSGGAADMVANAYTAPSLDEENVNSAVLEIVRDGILEVVDLKEVDGSHVHGITKRLFTKGHTDEAEMKAEQLRLAWDLQALYSENAARWQQLSQTMQTLVALLSVLMVALVVIRAELTSSSCSGRDAMSFLIIILPIAVATLVATDNRFRFGLRASILSSASMAIVQEIFRFRAQVADYMHGGCLGQDESNSILAAHLKSIRQAVAQTAVAEGTLRKASKPNKSLRSGGKFDPWYDDGLSKISPTDYLRLRLTPLLQHYRGSAQAADALRVHMLGAQNILISAATVMALVYGWQSLVAIPLSLALSLQTLKADWGLDVGVRAASKASADILNVLGWWRALGVTEGVSHQRYNLLVQEVERAHQGAMQACAPGIEVGGGWTDQQGRDRRGWVDELVGHMRRNHDKDGKFTFKKSWIEPYPGFFLSYQRWLEDKLYQQILKSAEATACLPDEEDGDGYGATDELIEALGEEDPTLAREQLQEVLGLGEGEEVSENVDAHYETINSEGVTEVRWSRFDFWERKTDVVEVLPGRCEMEDVESAVRHFNITDWMTRHQGWSSGPGGLVVLAGSSDTLAEMLVLHDDVKPGQTPAGARPRISQIGGGAERGGGGGSPGGVSVEEEPAPHNRLPEGLSPDQAQMRLKLLMSRGVLKAAEESHSIVLTSGVDNGAVRFIGRANLDRLHKVCMLGCAGKGLTTWPGDSRPHRETRLNLEGNHTHLALLRSHMDQAGVTRFRMDIAKAIWQRERIFGVPGQMPVVVVVVNGTEATVMEVLQYIRLGWRVVVVRGSGGCADAIAEAARIHKDEFVLNTRLLEIVKEGEGLLQFVNLSEEDGDTMRDTVKHILMAQESPEEAQHSSGAGPGEPGRPSRALSKRVDPNLALAWQQVVKYESNARIFEKRVNLYQNSLLCLSVLIITIVVINNDLRDDFSDSSVAGIQLAVVIGCIVLRVITLVAAKSSAWDCAAILDAAAEGIKSEIYKFRAGVGDYQGATEQENANALVEKCISINTSVVSTVVQEAGLEMQEVKRVKQAAFRVSAQDDGVSSLGTEAYLRLRLQVELSEFQRRSSGLERQLRLCQTLVYVLGGLSAALAAFGLCIWAAIPVSVVLALRCYSKQQRFEDKLAFYNNAIVELETNITGWKALSSMQMASSLRYSELVSRMEVLKQSQQRLLNPAVGDRANPNHKGEHMGMEGGMNLMLFKSDVLENLQKNGEVRFNQSWVENHLGFFFQYEDYLEKQGFFERVTRKIAATMAANQRMSGHSSPSGTPIPLRMPTFSE